MSQKDNGIPRYAICAKLDSAPRGAGEQMVCAAAQWLYRLITLISRISVSQSRQSSSMVDGGTAIEMARDANRLSI